MCVLESTSSSTGPGPRYADPTLFVRLYHKTTDCTSQSHFSPFERKIYLFLVVITSIHTFLG